MFACQGNFLQSCSLASDDIQLTLSSSNRTKDNMPAIWSPGWRVVNALPVGDLFPLFTIRADAA